MEGGSFLFSNICGRIVPLSPPPLPCDWRGGGTFLSVIRGKASIHFKELFKRFLSPLLAASKNWRIPPFSQWDNSGLLRRVPQGGFFPFSFRSTAQIFWSLLFFLAIRGNKSLLFPFLDGW